MASARVVRPAQGMDAALSHLLAEYNLFHYQDALEAVGLRCVADLKLVQDDDLLVLGMQRIQRRAFERLRAEASERSSVTSRPRGTLLGPRCVAQAPLQKPLFYDDMPSTPSSPSATSSAKGRRSTAKSIEGLAHAAAGATRGTVLLGQDAAELAQSLAEALSCAKATVSTKKPAASIPHDGEASPLPHLLGDRHSCEQKEPPQCVILDGRLVTPTHQGAWCESQGAPQGFLSVQQLRTAFDWFQERAPSCRVRVLLCGYSKDQWSAHPLMKDIRERLIWKPSGTDVDRFLVEVAWRGLDGQRVQIVTNSRLQRLLGTSIGGKVINAGWVKQSTIRFTFSGAAFCPALELRVDAANNHGEKPKRSSLWRLLPRKMQL